MAEQLELIAGTNIKLTPNHTEKSLKIDAETESNDGIPVGAHIWHCGDMPPDGYIVENGAALPRDVYHELFTVIGTKYGAGDGSTTFNIPNITGNKRFIRGSTSVGDLGIDNYRSHGHSIYAQRWNNYSLSGAQPFYVTPLSRNPGNIWRIAATFDNYVQENADTIENAGVLTAIGSGSTETCPVNISLLPCIKY